MKIYIGRYPKDDKERNVQVRIDKWDTWNMDNTLALIIAPMLKQLQATKQGAPLVDDEDVPDDLKSTAAPPKEHDYDIDGNHFKRWDWVMNEMLWAMQQIELYDNEGQFYDDSEVDESEDVMKQMKKMKVDYDGLKAHQARIQNGCRLFGKYFQSLWD
jgi:hypothetical protein